MFALFFLIAGCQGEDNPALPSLPADVVNVSKNSTISFASTSAASGEVLYVAWTDRAGGGNLSIFFSRSGDGGATFSPPDNISQSANFAGNAKLAQAGGTVYVVWEEFLPTDAPEKNESDIFFRRAEDQNGNVVWDPPLDRPGRNLSSTGPVCKSILVDQPPRANAPCPSQFPVVAASGNNVFIAWAEINDYIYIKRADTAIDFVIQNSEILLLASSNKGADFSPSSIEVARPKPGDVPGGIPPTRISSPSFNPSLALAGGKLYVTWEDFLITTGIAPTGKIFFRALSEGSIVAPTVEGVELSNPFPFSSRPSLAADNNNVYVIWEYLPLGPDGNPLSASELLFTRSEDQGLNFASAVNFSNNSGGSNSPRIAASGSFVSVAWEDTTPALRGISLRKSENGGLSFGPVESLSGGTGSASNPSLAASGSTLFSFWEDSTLGNLEIVFARR